MSGRVPKTLKTLRFQLEVLEWVINTDYNYLDPFTLKWKRHYLLKRIADLQVKEFDND